MKVAVSYILVNASNGVLCDHRAQEANSAVVEMTVDSTQANFLAVAAEIVALGAVVNTGSAEDFEVVVDIDPAENSGSADSVRTVPPAAAMTEAHSAVPGSGYSVEQRLRRHGPCDHY